MFICYLQCFRMNKEKIKQFCLAIPGHIDLLQYNFPTDPAVGLFFPVIVQAELVTSFFRALRFGPGTNPGLEVSFRVRTVRNAQILKFSITFQILVNRLHRVLCGKAVIGTSPAVIPGIAADRR